MTSTYIQPFLILLIFACQIFPFNSFKFCCAIQEEWHAKDFYVLTIPKSGSHLIWKMLNMLTDKKAITAGTIFPQLHAFT